MSHFCLGRHLAHRLGKMAAQRASGTLKAGDLGSDQLPRKLPHRQVSNRMYMAGPTTLLSLLVSLRVGFRSLAIQKHSNEVWKVLAAIKTEFGKFGGILDKVSKKLRETQEVLDSEVGVRRRAMDRKLREIEVLPKIEAVSLLELEGP